MSLPPAPVSEKQNQHVVPRFWQERFAGKDGRIFARYRPGADPKGKKVAGARQVRVGATMTEEWTYTVFDRNPCKVGARVSSTHVCLVTRDPGGRFSHVLRT